MMIRTAFSVLILLAHPALSQGYGADCAAERLGQLGCAPGVSPYVDRPSLTLGDRGDGWYSNDPAPDDGVYGALPYESKLGRTTDSYGNPYSDTLGGGCRQTLGGAQVCD